MTPEERESVRSDVCIGWSVEAQAGRDHGGNGGSSSMRIRAAGLLRHTLLAAGVLMVAAPASLRAGVALTEGHFDDPFAYCAAVGTIDAPDARFTGPAMPEAVVRGLKAALDLPADLSDAALAGNSVLRCMDGKVYACTVGANLPCSERADTGRKPAPALHDFCRQSPDAAVIPMAVTGHATVFEWRCAGDTPTIVRQFGRADAAGYLARIWHQIDSAAR
jgi:hypothetical protein